MDILFDIVIPVGPNDSLVIEKMLEYTKKNIIGYRNIFLVCYNSELFYKDCIIINENIFPFSKKSISEYIGDTERNGWYLQQLIKLYSGSIIPNILNNYLVIDADTFFLKPTNFFKDKIPLYNTGSEYNMPYFDHMAKLHPTLTKQSMYSGICHHMMFQKNIMIELFNLIEVYHKDEFYKIFLKLINKKDILGSGASEYEIYFNYLLLYHKNKMTIRKLKWENSSNFDSNHDYISNHWYMR